MLKNKTDLVTRTFAGINAVRGAAIAAARAAYEAADAHEAAGPADCYVLAEAASVAVWRAGGYTVEAARKRGEQDADAAASEAAARDAA